MIQSVIIKVVNNANPIGNANVYARS
ncbi:hypothetical protein THIOSC13_1350068 [uncultured Thiomicrorhabdus sp.]